MSGGGSRSFVPRAPILLLHGILDTPDVWRDVATRLDAAGRSVLLDTTHDTKDHSPQAQAARVRELIPPEGAHLVGHSRGATAASWIALEHPDLARSLAIVASPPHASEVFRAAFRKRLERAAPDERSALTYLANIAEDDFPQHALRRYRGRALVVEYEDDPLYSPTQTMFWRMFLPYADFERVPGAHRAFAEDASAAEWLARRLLAHVETGEGAADAPEKGSP